MLKIDITFDDNQSSNNQMMSNFFNQGPMFESAMPKTHQGLASCRLITNYVQHYKCLKEVAIILKLFLAKMDLNSPYHGKFISPFVLMLILQAAYRATPQ